MIVDIVCEKHGAVAQYYRHPKTDPDELMQKYAAKYHRENFNCECPLREIVRAEKP